MVFVVVVAVVVVAGRDDGSSEKLFTKQPENPAPTMPVKFNNNKSH